MDNKQDPRMACDGEPPSLGCVGGYDPVEVYRIIGAITPHIGKERKEDEWIGWGEDYQRLCLPANRPFDQLDVWARIKGTRNVLRYEVHAGQAKVFLRTDGSNEPWALIREVTAKDYALWLTRGTASCVIYQ